MPQQQQEFLRDAMRRLNLTRNAFAERLGVRRRALDTWLLPEDSSESRAMPDMVGKFVTEILRHEALAAELPGQPDHRPLADRIAVEGQRHLLSVSQFDRGSLEDLFHVADVMQPIARRQKVSRVLEGAVLGSLFFEASTRTRVSFGAAFCRLGGSVCDTTGFTFSSMAKGESIYDTSRVMSGYVDALVVRHPEQGSVAEFARATNIPVINAGDGPGEHPSQAVLDVYTIQREFSRQGRLLDGAHVAIVGDLKYGRTVHSLIRLLSLYRGLRFTLVAPPSLEMPHHLVELAAQRGHAVETGGSLEAGLRGADVVYATRVQKERFEGEAMEGYTPEFQVRKGLVDAVCRPDTILMHPLPRDGRPGANDLSTDLNHDPRLAIFRQTDNGIAVRMALFAVLMGVETQVAGSLRDATWKSPRYVGPDDATFDGLE
ncbi:aspartate carbamoyltransferase [Acidovorax sp. NCPPB 3859]|nr:MULTISPECIES: aspartate carbamoyltransferase [unclassified Acidovorax]MDA8448295.1 aspartate carbamoyltransferase [Acidovorax sp. GBBC 3297]MDA8457738.1 aspartate carbamoyltransferase [Acidovorax sp. GBBC 3333]MDA8462738.1 aspartate carbamoyltransferase [Acidovorax sp. GBBC 3332]MDA8467808.1 aspartate carbamoyltransferase [Acidovorax sp. GBBC 3299]WCM77828.1 aspartate carbamoyltransferase [Acidovorax sp. GBBC 712]